MGILDRCREPKVLPPGVAAACDAPSLLFALFAEFAIISFRNCSLFIATRIRPEIEDKNDE